MDSCSIQCGHGSETTLPGPATVRYQGPPGKRGPRGLKGSKGESSNQCDCATIHGLATTIQKLQVELNKTKSNSTVWYDGKHIFDIFELTTHGRKCSNNTYLHLTFADVV